MTRMSDTPREILGLGPRQKMCVCDKGKELPAEPLDQHSYGCLLWDWALIAKKITPAERMKQLDKYSKELEN